MKCFHSSAKVIIVGKLPLLIRDLEQMSVLGIDRGVFPATGEKKTLDEAESCTMQAICLPYGREEELLRGTSQQTEEAMRATEGVLSFGLRPVDERADLAAHMAHELEDPLVLAVGRSLKERLPVRRMLDLLVVSEGAHMVGPLRALHDDLQVVGPGENRRLPLGTVGRDRIAVRVELDEGGLAHGRRDHPVRAIRKGRQGKERLVEKGGCGCFIRGPVDPLVPFLAPRVYFSVEVREVGEVMGLDEISNILYNAFHAPFFVGFPRVAAMDGKAEVTGEVDELGIQGELRFSPDNDEPGVVIPLTAGHPLDLLIGTDVTVEKEFHGRAGIELRNEVPGIGQDEDEPVDLAKGQRCLHPINLSTFARQEFELMVGPAPRLSEGPGGHRYPGVASLVAVVLELRIDLRCPQPAVLCVPRFDEPEIRVKERGPFLSLGPFFPLDDRGDGPCAHMQLLGDLAHGKPLDLIEVFHLTCLKLVHGNLPFFEKHKREVLIRPSRLLSVTIGCKRPFPNPLQAYLVFYHPHGRIRDEQDEPLEGFGRTYLVFYHALPFSPGFHIGLVEMGKVAGVLVAPCFLCGLFPCLPARRVRTGLLFVLNTVIWGKIPPAEKALLNHPSTPSR